MKIFEYDKNILKQARFLFWLSGVKNIELVEGDVLKLLPLFDSEPIDFVFLDDCKANYRKNFETVFPLLSDNAIVCAHDTNQVICGLNSAIDFGNYLKSRSDFNVIQVDLFDRGLTIAQKKAVL